MRLQNVSQWMALKLWINLAPQNLEGNVDVFDQALNKYLAEYEKVGICPRHFESMTEFIESCSREISEEI